ncbi:MAG: DUF456 domain-containing protein [Phycisphaerales bacterium]|nr:DUF456 domain-containing protein [Phycisphaerales bacterium]
MTSLAAAIVILMSGLGVALTTLTLPGAWVALLTAVICKLWRPELLDWSTIGIGAAIALIGEVVEIFASAAGAARAGGSRRGAIGAVVGSLLGAIIGAPFLLLVGAIIGAVIGAGLGAIIAERGFAGRTWKDSARIGAGAAVGRFWASVAKVGLCGVVALILTIGVLR